MGANGKNLRRLRFLPLPFSSSLRHSTDQHLMYESPHLFRTLSVSNSHLLPDLILVQSYAIIHQLA